MEVNSVFEGEPMATKSPPRQLAVACMASVEIWCPNCRHNPIPSPDGSFLWKEMPSIVKCNECGKQFRVGKRIRL